MFSDNVFIEYTIFFTILFGLMGVPFIGMIVYTYFMDKARKCSLIQNHLGVDIKFNEKEVDTNELTNRVVNSLDFLVSECEQRAYSKEPKYNYKLILKILRSSEIVIIPEIYYTNGGPQRTANGMAQLLEKNIFERVIHVNKYRTFVSERFIKNIFEKMPEKAYKILASLIFHEVMHFYAKEELGLSDMDARHFKRILWEESWDIDFS